MDPRDKKTGQGNGGVSGGILPIWPITGLSCGKNATSGAQHVGTLDATPRATKQKVVDDGISTTSY